jgi:hypothetical protein
MKTAHRKVSRFHKKEKAMEKSPLAISPAFLF